MFNKLVSISDTKVYVLIIICSSIFLFLISNRYLGGYLENKQKLGAEIGAPTNALYEWNLAERPPFQYRVLFPTIVKSTWMLFFNNNDNEAFYLTYYVYSLIFFITVPLVFYFFLRKINFTPKASLLGSFLYLLNPAVLMAYSLPVHTREDTLAYSILLLGLFFLLYNKDYMFLAICVIGIICRETLLILPLLYFFFKTERSILKRVVCGAIPGICWIALRVAIGVEVYDPLEGMQWNLQHPLQVVCFTILTFHFMWMPTFYQMFTRRLVAINNLQKYLLNQLPWVVFIIFFTTFVGGIINEIRLLNLMFPWMITTALLFLINYADKIRNYIRSKLFLIYQLMLFALFSLAVWFVYSKDIASFFVSEYNIPFQAWILVALVYMFVILSFFPLFIGIINHEVKVSSNVRT